jgi:hypothetical protein
MSEVVRWTASDVGFGMDAGCRFRMGGGSDDQERVRGSQKSAEAVLRRPALLVKRSGHATATSLAGAPIATAIPR